MLMTPRRIADILIVIAFFVLVASLIFMAWQLSMWDNVIDIAPECRTNLPA